MTEPIAIIEKNTIEDVRITLSECKGRRRVDIRTYVEVSDGKERVPTKKGISLSVDALPDLLAALTTADGQVRAHKWEQDARAGL